LNALTAAVASLQALYGKSQCMIHIGECATIPANQDQNHEIDIVICTTQGYHLLSQLPMQPKSFMHHATKCEPLLLGFECQAVLRACLDKYDYFCYLEDDLILHDPWFFNKLNWFRHHGGNGNLLQPNRYEVSPQAPVFKAYIDGDLTHSATANFQNIEEQRQLIGKIMEQKIAFERALNPHSGCYFLNAEQMAYWAKQSHFLDRDTSFVGPLESAATLGIMRTFRVYKPVSAYANFLEIQHFGSSFLKLIGNKVRLSEV
ncbi:calcium-binding protein, partial [Microcoleus sp. CAWBG640]|uniref:calcium-binding protein n=1 Tax=Microcoleus sp. CAWBG640 TaxID=2841653 RepID=UPI00312BA96D